MDNVLMNEIRTYEWMNVTRMLHLLINLCPMYFQCMILVHETYKLWINEFCMIFIIKSWVVKFVMEFKEGWNLVKHEGLGLNLHLAKSSYGWWLLWLHHKIEKKFIPIQTLLFSSNCGYPLPIHGVKNNLAHTNVWNLFMYATHFVLKALQYW
jgi:hypothetical protein